MASWSPLDWVAYICIAIAAVIPALGLAVSAEASLKEKYKAALENRWWKIVPAAALVISGGIISANQLGWIDHTRPTSPKTITKIEWRTKTITVSDPKQVQEIADLQAAIDGHDGYKEQIAKLKKRLTDHKVVSLPKSQTPGMLNNGTIQHLTYDCNVGLGGVNNAAGAQIGDAHIIGNTNGSEPPTNCISPKTPQ